MDTAPGSRPNPYTITYALIAINVLVYLAMVARHISPTDPAAQDVLNWGGDYGPATLGAHQYWRLLTSCFLHFGIIHIAFNMYVLYQIGPFIQISFGRARYSVIYFLAGSAAASSASWSIRTPLARAPPEPSSVSTAPSSASSSSSAAPLTQP